MRALPLRVALLAMALVSFSVSVQAEESDNGKGGNRNGQPSEKLSFYGFDTSLSVTGIAQGARHANGSNLPGVGDAAEGSYSLDVTVDKNFDFGGELYVDVNAADGAGVDQDLQVFSGVNYNAVDSHDRLSISEAWYQQKFGAFSARAGKFDPSCFIDTNNYANDETAQFLSWIFVDSPVVEFPIEDAAGLGLSGDFGPVGFDCSVSDTKPDLVDMFDNVFMGGQLWLKPKFLGREGTYRFIGWRNNRFHTRWLEPDQDRESSHGYGVSFDQEITPAIGVFARYGWQDPKVFLNDADFSLEKSFSFGPQVKGALWGRKDDVVGFAYGRIFASKEYKEATGRLGRPENHLECYYNCRLNKHFSLSPDFQVIWSPFGRDAANGDTTVMVFGLRGQLDF